MNRLIDKGIFLLVVLCALSRVFSFPVLGNKLQPFEFLFVPVFICFAVQHFKNVGKRNSWLLFFNPIDISLIFFLALITVNAALHHTQNVLLEIIGCLYMLAIYFLFSRTAFLGFGLPKISKAFQYAVALSAAGCLFGAIAYYAFGNNHYVMDYGNSPYLGNIVRMSGLSSSSNLMASFAGFCFIFCFPFIKGFRIWLFLLLVVCLCIASQSKESFYFLALMLLYLFLKKLYGKFGLSRTAILGFITYLFLFVVCTLAIFWVYCTHNCDSPSISMGEPIQVAQGKYVRPTAYYYLYTVAQKSIAENPLIGIGLGNFHEKTNQFQEQGLYPKSLLTYEAHDLYWGMVAQLGIGYIIFSLLFIGIILYCIYFLWKKSLIPKTWCLAFLFCLLFVCLDILGDVGALNFRHYWIVLGLLSGVYSQKKLGLSYQTD